MLVGTQIALRTCPFDLRIRPSISLPIHSTLCLTIVGPNYCLRQPSHVDCDCLLFSHLFALFPFLSLLASVCARPSSRLGSDSFLHPPALLGSCKNVVSLGGGHLLSSLFSPLSVFFHPVGGREEGQAMATAHARWIAATPSRSILKVQRFEPPNKPSQSVAVVQNGSCEDLWLPFL